MMAAEQQQQQQPMDEKQRVDAVIKIVSNSFLDFRRTINAILSPELGMLDDMVVVWTAQHVPAPAEPDKDKDEQKQKPNVTKTGDLYIRFYLKTPPAADTGKQESETFTVKSTISFASDIHPVIQAGMQKAAAAAAAGGATGGAVAAPAPAVAEAPPVPVNDKVEAVTAAAVAKDKEQVTELITPGAAKN